MAIDKDLERGLELMFSPRPKENDADGKRDKRGADVFKSHRHAADCPAVAEPRTRSCDCERSQLVETETVTLSAEQIGMIADLLNKSALSTLAARELRDFFAMAIDCNVTKYTS